MMDEEGVGVEASTSHWPRHLVGPAPTPSVKVQKPAAESEPEQLTIDPCFNFMLAGASAVYGPEDLAGLVTAASRSKGLVDTVAGSVRVMNAETGREALRETRDPSAWRPATVDGRLLIMYGPYAVAAVREHLKEHAPPASSLPHLEAEKAALQALVEERGEEQIPYHRFRHAWRIRWVQPDAYGAGYFTLEETGIPQLWWAVAQNVIVPLKVIELVEKYPAAYGKVLQHPTGWGAAGHIAWTLCKNVGDDLSVDKMYRACMAGTPLQGELSADVWPDGVTTEKGWPGSLLVEEAIIMEDEATLLAIVGKWEGWRSNHPNSSKDESVVMQAGLGGGGDAELVREVSRARALAVVRAASALVEASNDGRRAEPPRFSAAPVAPAANEPTAAAASASRDHLMKSTFLTALVVTKECDAEVGYDSGDDDEEGTDEAAGGGGGGAAISDLGRRMLTSSRSALHQMMCGMRQGASGVLHAPAAALGRPSTVDAAADAASSSPEAAASTAAAVERAPEKLHSQEQAAALKSVVRRPTFRRGMAVEQRSNKRQLQPSDLTPQAKSLAKARSRSLANQCVRYRREPDTNETVLERVPLRFLPRLPTVRCLRGGRYRFEVVPHPLEYEDLEFGVPVAMMLFLRLLLGCAFTLLLLLLIAIPEMSDNTQRSELHHECREHASEHASALPSLPADAHHNATSSPAPAPLAGCGYEGLAVKHFGAASLPTHTWQRSFALGTCMEYSVNSTVTLPSPCLPGMRVLLTGQTCIDNDFDAAFVFTPAAGYCLDDNLWRRWFGPILQVLVFVAFLLHMKQMSKSVARKVDMAFVSAANYGAMISGLQRGVFADTSNDGRGQDELLIDDLAALGFSADEIDHIEIGRDCRKELLLYAKLESLKVLEAEIEARKHEVLKRGGASDKTKARLEKQHLKAWTDMAAAQRELQEIRRVPQRTTGHAFVCFKREARRNELLDLFRRPNFLEQPIAFLLRNAIGEEWVAASLLEDLPDLKTAARPTLPWSGLEAYRAPEPRDILWENLVTDGSRSQALFRAITRVATAVTVFLGMILCVITQSFEAVVSNDEAVYTSEQALLPRGTNNTEYELLQSAFRTYGAQFASVAIVSGVNQVLKIVVPQLTKLETHNTHVDFEKAVFGKLALAYVLNTALLPMAVGLLPMGITQAWYEEDGLVSIMMIFPDLPPISTDLPPISTDLHRSAPISTDLRYEEGGLVSIMMTQMVTAGVGFSFFQLLQPESLFRRKVLGRSAIGQPSLDRLFAPPKILFAEIHASTIKVRSPHELPRSPFIST